MRLSLRTQLRMWKIYNWYYPHALANDDAALCEEYDMELFQLEVGDED